MHENDYGKSGISTCNDDHFSHHKASNVSSEYFDHNISLASYHNTPTKNKTK